MRKLLAVGVALIAMLAMVGMGAAIFSSYGRVTGYATLEQSLDIDIMGSSNDTFYSLRAYQGESVYSPKIKLVNRASVPINVSVNVTFEPNSNEISTSLWNENKTSQMSQDFSVPSSDLYFYVLHEFKPNASAGNYTFDIEVLPS